MANKRIRFLIAIMLVLSMFITGCSDGGSSKSAQDEEMVVQTTIPTSTPTPTPSPAPTNTPTPRPTNTPIPTPTPGFHFSDIEKYEYMGYFNEGYAWVSYKTGDYSTCTQLVDRRGYVYYETTESVEYMAPVQDGVTWIRVGLVSSDETVERIIDTAGHVLYRTQPLETDTESSREHIIGYGNGKFLVIRTTTNLNGIQHTLGTINNYGGEIDPFWEAPDLSETGFARYIQDDYFWYGSNLYNVVDQTVVEFETICGEDNLNRPCFFEAYYFGDTPYTSEYVVNCMESVPFEAGQAHSDGVDYHTVCNYFDTSFDQLVTYGGDLDGPYYILSDLHYMYHGYYDLNGNRVMDIPQYQDLGMWCSDFNDEGYAMMILDGADGYDYITVIDENLTEQFEPFRFIRDYLGPYNFSPYVLNGTFVCQTADGLCLYNVDGTLQRVLIEPIDPDEFITDGGRSIGVECFFDDYLIVHWYENSSRYDMYLFY